MSPAIPIAIVMSTISKRKIFRRAPESAPAIRFGQLVDPGQQHTAGVGAEARSSLPWKAS